MSRRAWVIVAVVVLVVGIAGAAAWYAFGGSDPSGPALPDRASGATGAAVSADGAWTVTEDGSFVGYRISERFVGGLTDIEAVGRTSDVRGGFTVADRRVTDVEIEADLATLASDKAPRDNYLRTRALETDTYPTARFVAAGPIVLPRVTRGNEVEVAIAGTLTLHGVSRPLSLPVTARWNGRTIDLVGSAPIVLADYGIEAPNTPLVSVEGRGAIEIQLVLVPAG